MRLRYLIAALILGAAASVLVVGLAVGKETGGFDSAGSDFTATSIQEFGEFPVYWLGEQFGANPLHAIHRRTGSDQSLAPGRPNYMSLKYGDCEPGGDGGCAASLEIQVWPACERNRSSLQLVPDIDGSGPAQAVPYPREDAEVRGVPAAFYDNATRLELYTGEVTVVLFGRSRDQLLNAADMLEGASGTVVAVSATEELPAPEAGALAGKLACS
jgi:hypothetical protein